MNKKNGISFPDNFFENLRAAPSPLDKHHLGPHEFRPVSVIKVPLDMHRRLHTIAKVNMMEPWEVIETLLEYRFKESA